MNRFLQATLLLLLSISLAFTGVKMSNHSRLHKSLPAPTDNDEREGNQHQLKRQAWIENMHRIAPGISWQAIDQQTRMQRMAHSRSIDSMAGGAVQGFWKETGSLNQAGRVHQADPDYANNTLYAASSGGIVWKGPMAGGNWTPLNDRLKIPDIIKIKKIGSRILTVSSTNGVVPVHYSDNEGTSWQLATGLNVLAASSADYVARAVVANDSAHSIYLLAKESGSTVIYKSVDQGTSFTRIKNYPSGHYHSLDYFDIWTAPNGSGKVYLYQNDSVFYIGNGNTFNFLGKVGTAGNTNFLLAGAEVSGNTYLYVAASDGANTNFFASPDGGNNWGANGSVANVAFGRNSFDASQTTPNKIYFGTVNFSVSTDGGGSWNDVNDWSQYYGDPENLLHADIDGIQSMVDQQGHEVVYISNDGGLYRSVDGMASVKNLSLQTLRVGQYYSTYTSRVNPEVIYAGSQDQGMQISRTYNSGVRTFEQAISGDYGHIVSGDGGASMWSVYPGFAMYYPDALNSDNIVTWDFLDSNALWLQPIVADPEDPTSAYLLGGTLSGTGSHLIHLSAVGGSINYTELPFDFGNGNNYKISAYAISSIDHHFQYVMNEFGDFYYTSDAGAHWTRNSTFNGPGAHYFYGATIVASAKTLGTVYIGGSGYTSSAAYATTDHGQHFTAINTNLPSTLIFEMAINTSEDKLFAATEVGPYVYIVPENKWYDLSGPTVPDQTYWTVDYIPQLNTARFGTYGRGIWDLVLCDSNTVKPAPHFTYAAGGNGATINFTNQTNGVLDYVWDFGNGTTSTDKSPTAHYATSGTFHVTLTATNGCSADTFGMDVPVMRTGINYVDEAGIQLYPNPSTGRFVVTAEGQTIENIKLYDVAGRILVTTNNIAVSSYNMDISADPKGIYFVDVAIKGQPRKVFKVVVE